MAARPEPPLPLFNLPPSKCRKCGSTNSPFFYPDIPDPEEDDDMQIEKKKEASELLLCHACYYRTIHGAHRTSLADDEWDDEDEDSSMDEDEW